MKMLCKSSAVWDASDLIWFDLKWSCNLQQVAGNLLPFENDSFWLAKLDLFQGLFRAAKQTFWSPETELQCWQKSIGLLYHTSSTSSRTPLTRGRCIKVTALAPEVYVCACACVRARVCAHIMHGRNACLNLTWSFCSVCCETNHMETFSICL